MNISNIRVKLTQKDLVGMINENINIEGVSIESINIDGSIGVVGCVKKGVNFKFLANLYFENVKNNVLSLRISNIKVAKIPIWSKLVNFVLKKSLKNFKSMGIAFENKVIFLDFSLLLKYVPAVNFVLKDIQLFKEYMEVEVENLVYSENKKALSIEELKEEIKKDTIEADDKENSDKDANFEKPNVETVDEYSKIRENVKGNLPEKISQYEQYIFLVPDIIALLYRLMRDSRVKTKTKVLIGATISYLALPVDIIPDFIPVMGKLDDFGIVFLLLDKIIDSVPEGIISEHWQGQQDIIKKIKEIKGVLFKTLGREKAIKIIGMVFVVSKKIVHKKKKK